MHIDDFVERMNHILPLLKRRMVSTEASPFLKGTITMPQYFALELLYDMKDAKMSDMARELNITGPAVTGIIDRLEKAGFTERVPSKSDRRVVFVKLTKKGIVLAEDMRVNLAKSLKETFGQLSEKERAAYITILEKVYKILTNK